MQMMALSPTSRMFGLYMDPNVRSVTGGGHGLESLVHGGVV
jgi:hypothetical protein